MKTINVKEAAGPALNWLVAKCVFADSHTENDPAYWVHPSNPEHVCVVSLDARGRVRGNRLFCPATDWAQGGPLIEREKIEMHYEYGDKEWKAVQFLSDEWVQAHGPTPLIAAMRCYVASKLGETAEVPEELL